MALKEVNVPRLKAGEASTESATLRVDQLGWMVPRGKASATKRVTETDSHSDARIAPIETEGLIVRGDGPTRRSASTAVVFGKD